MHLTEEEQEFWNLLRLPYISQSKRGCHNCQHRFIEDRYDYDRLCYWCNCKEIVGGKSNLGNVWTHRDVN